jgi:hypothetical protein
MMDTILEEPQPSTEFALDQGAVTFLRMSVEPAEGGANVSVTGFVPLPKAPVPTPEESNKHRLVSLDLLKQALPGLIPQLVHELVQRDIESRWVIRSDRGHADQ